jgi:AhpD family alkylhydroperoxidase
MGALLARATRRATLAQIRHVGPVPPHRACGLVAEVYRRVEREFGMLAPPMSLHSPAPEVLAAAWVMLRESLLANGFASRAEKESVAAAVSALNACPYCVDVHGTTLAGLDPSAIASLSLPFPADKAAELTGVTVTFHYLNRMVNVFLPESPFPSRVPGAALARLRRAAARLMAGLARPRHVPGASLDLLPPADIPPDLAWAADSPVIEDAFARGYAAIDDAGSRSVPPAVRDLVHAELASRTRPPREPIARLAWLVAFESYRVTDALIADFRARYPDDRTLIEFTSWVSLTAARLHDSSLSRPSTGAIAERA